MLICKYYHTLRFLKWRQIYYQLWYRFRRLFRTKSGFSYPVSYPCEGKVLVLVSFIDKNPCLGEGNIFTFLNQTLVFNGWNEKRNGKLWSYNLNYMDYLHQEEDFYERGEIWINRFLEGVKGNKDGLEPYPIALRGINWIKFFSRYQDRITIEEKKRWDASLYAQYKILEDNLEYHLLGNHLLEDAFSLFWAGLYFQEKGFYDRAVKLLKQELAEQILPDGGHYELSPMYHEILLDRLLDCINASRNNLRFEGQDEITCFMEQKATGMLGWLDGIVYRDGSIPLFNDAALGVAPEAEALRAYGRRLGLVWTKTELRESGYRKYETSRMELVVDIGKIGPDYIPGHAHADTLNYELRIDGKPFIVDTGTTTYTPGHRRMFERGTSAHNTVALGNMNSSCVWGAFRVAERASVTPVSETGNSVTTEHNGFRRAGVKHRRCFRLNYDCLSVTDYVTGKTNRQVVSRIIFHPDVQILSVSSDCIHTDRAEIGVYGARYIELEDVDISLGYNKLCRTKSACLFMLDKLEYQVSIDLT